MRVPHDAGAAAFTGQLTTFLAAVSDLDDVGLLAATRCRGWLACDLLVHVHLGLQEMLLGLLDPTDDDPDRDAATYWTAFTPGGTDAGTDTDGLDGDLFTRRVAAAYRRPTSAVAHLRPTADGLVRAVRAAGPGNVRFQGHVLSTGDFLATWAVELVVHHLDLALTSPNPHPAALAMARDTVEALVGELPAAWSDEAVVLVGTGRTALDERMHAQAGPAGTRLPAFG